MTDNVIAKAVAEELAGIVEPIARDIVFELKRVGACLSERNKRDAARYELAGVEAALKHEANVTGYRCHQCGSAGRPTRPRPARSWRSEWEG